MTVRKFDRVEARRCVGSISFINCYLTSTFEYGDKGGIYNGTMKDLVQKLRALGARPGDKVTFGVGVTGPQTGTVIQSADERTGGIWVL